MMVMRARAGRGVVEKRRAAFREVFWEREGREGRRPVRKDIVLVVEEGGSKEDVARWV